MTAPAWAAITVDGTLDASYGAALAVQTVTTGFGDTTSTTNGGELDAGYAKVWNDRLYVLITGNVEGNFNKIHLFIDSKAGGENVLSSTPNYDGGRSQNFGGLTFDTGFEADYHVFGRWNGGAFEVDIVDRDGGTCVTCGGNFGAATVGSGNIQSGTVFASGNGTTPYLSTPAEFGFNNTNLLGVVGGDPSVAADMTAAAAVTTGFEFSVALADIGSPAIGSVINIHAAYGNGDNNYHSNQILGGLPVQGNLGGDGAGGFTGTLSGINFNNFAGSQFFRVPVTGEVIPEPSSVVLSALACLGGLGLARRKR
ncbi:PEP-CTERM sorting domain-containing protein [Pirellulimonas nuda]|nr:PEP-CTERM sorting domain-containing protein [Pirellulimonas nuda]